MNLVSVVAAVCLSVVGYFLLKTKRLTALRALIPSIPFSYQYRIYLSPIGYYLNLSGEKDAPHSKVKPIEFPGVKTIPIAIRGDNYAYLIIDKVTNLAAVVDPSDPKFVLEALKSEGAILTAILTTHKHWDHSGGNKRLLAVDPKLKVYGSNLDPVPLMNYGLIDNDEIKIGSLVFKAIESRVHTKGHILYYLMANDSNSPNMLFSGDAVFVGGAGQFFESTGKELYHLIERLKSKEIFPGNTLLFPGHEYTLPNFLFAISVDPTNTLLKTKLEWTKNQLKDRIGTIPSTLQDEFETNPFFRYDERSMRENLPPPAPSHQASQEMISIHYVSEIRKAKDIFGEKASQEVDRKDEK